MLLKCQSSLFPGFFYCWWNGLLWLRVVRHSFCRGVGRLTSRKSARVFFWNFILHMYIFLIDFMLHMYIFLINFLSANVWILCYICLIFYDFKMTYFMILLMKGKAFLFFWNFMLHMYVWFIDFVSAFVKSLVWKLFRGLYKYK